MAFVQAIRQWGLAIALGILACVASPCHAGFAYRIGLGYRTNPGLQLAPGQQSSVIAFLMEDDIPGPNPSVSLANSSVEVSFLVQRISGDASLSIPIQYFNGFGQITSSTSTTQAQIRAFAPLPISNLSGSTRFATIAEIPFTMGSQNTTFQIQPSGNPALIVGGAPNPLAGVGQVTFTAVPEPSSALLLAFAAMPIVAAVRRRSAKRDFSGSCSAWLTSVAHTQQRLFD